MAASEPGASPRARFQFRIADILWGLVWLSLIAAGTRLFPLLGILALYGMLLLIVDIACGWTARARYCCAALWLIGVVAITFAAIALGH